MGQRPLSECLNKINPSLMADIQTTMTSFCQKGLQIKSSFLRIIYEHGIGIDFHIICNVYLMRKKSGHAYLRNCRKIGYAHFLTYYNVACFSIRIFVIVFSFLADCAKIYHFFDRMDK